MAAGGLPAVNGKQVIRALEKAGFVVSRTSDSHFMLADESHPTRLVIVLVHGSRDMKRGTLEASGLNGRAVQGVALTNRAKVLVRISSTLLGAAVTFGWFGRLLCRSG